MTRDACVRELFKERRGEGGQWAMGNTTTFEGWWAEARLYTASQLVAG